jgi:hypothetical protein
VTAAKASTPPGVELTYDGYGHAYVHIDAGVIEIGTDDMAREAMRVLRAVRVHFRAAAAERRRVVAAAMDAGVAQQAGVPEAWVCELCGTLHAGPRTAGDVCGQCAGVAGASPEPAAGEVQPEDLGVLDAIENIDAALPPFADFADVAAGVDPLAIPANRIGGLAAVARPVPVPDALDALIQATTMAPRTVTGPECQVCHVTGEPGEKILFRPAVAGGPVVAEYYCQDVAACDRRRLAPLRDRLPLRDGLAAVAGSVAYSSARADLADYDQVASELAELRARPGDAIHLDELQQAVERVERAAASISASSARVLAEIDARAGEPRG